MTDLTDVIFIELITKHSHMTTINIRACLILTSISIFKIAELCHELTILNISGNPW